ncbi:MAG: hypothetical protein MUP44_11330 [Anaerolineales bacterium]|nr:hypothetical protein [Anaerolineales bacterium]
MRFKFRSEFLEYLAAHASEAGKHLPTLAELAKELNFSIRNPRELLAVERVTAFISFE